MEPYDGKGTGLLERTKAKHEWGIGLLAISVAFSPDGKILAAGGYDRMVKLWDVTSGKQIGTLQGHGAVVFSIAFSPDGKTLASASADGTVKLWNVGEKQETSTLKSDVASVLSVRFSPDGKTLAAGVYKEDGQSEVRIWNIATLTEKSALKGSAHKWQGLISLVFSPDGK